jgi:hypothetical protein
MAAGIPRHGNLVGLEVARRRDRCSAPCPSKRTGEAWADDAEKGVRRNAYLCVATSARNRENKLSPPSPIVPG